MTSWWPLVPRETNPIQVVESFWFPSTLRSSHNLIALRNCPDLPELRQRNRRSKRWSFSTYSEFFLFWVIFHIFAIFLELDMWTVIRAECAINLRNYVLDQHGLQVPHPTFSYYPNVLDHEQETRTSLHRPPSSFTINSSQIFPIALISEWRQSAQVWRNNPCTTAQTSILLPAV